jgi:hypothetical protein
MNNNHDNGGHGSTVKFVSGTTQEDIQEDNKSLFKVLYLLPTHQACTQY